MVKLSTFKDFLGLANAATHAAGLLQLDKAPGFEATAFTIPKGEKFVTGGKQYATAEAWEIPESKTDPTDVGITALRDGEGGNLPASQVWQSPVLNIVATNPLPITGGLDQRPGLYPQAAGKTGPTDTALQRALDVAEQVIRAVIGLKATEPLEMDSRVEQGIMLLAMYRWQNSTVQERAHYPPSQHGAAPREQDYFRHQVYQPLMRQVSSLVSHKTKYGRIINGEDT